MSAKVLARSWWFYSPRKRLFFDTKVTVCLREILRSTVGSGDPSCCRLLSDLLFPWVTTAGRQNHHSRAKNTTIQQINLLLLLLKGLNNNKNVLINYHNIPMEIPILTEPAYT